MASEVLKKIGEIEIDSAKLDVAKNGAFYLVENTGKDAYGNPKCEVYSFVEPEEKCRQLSVFCHNLVQVIGNLIVERDALAAQLASAVRVAKE